MNILKSIIFYVSWLVSIVLMAGCSHSQPAELPAQYKNLGWEDGNISLNRSIYRDLGWREGSPQIYWSVLDAMDQALSMQINGDNLHSHQIAMRSARNMTFYQQAQQAGQELCSEIQTKSDWSELKCVALKSASKLSEEEKAVLCNSDPHCGLVWVANFVQRDPELLDVLKKSMANPCQFIPDFEDLKRRHHAMRPRGGQTMHTADVSYHWLFCDAKNQVHGELKQASIFHDGLFVAKWSK